MAMACLRLVTFLPLRPDFSLPCFIAFISRSTDLPALGLYLREPADFFEELFFGWLFFADDFFAELILAELFFFVAIFSSPTQVGTHAETIGLQSTQPSIRDSEMFTVFSARPCRLRSDTSHRP